MAKPGVMFYFDMRPCIRRLETEDRVKLFEAILDYGEFGILPEFEGVLGVAWDFIQPKLDRDTEQYNIKVEKSQYAVYSRECKKNGIIALSFGDWRRFYTNDPNQTMSHDVKRYPESTSSLTAETETNLHANNTPAVQARNRKDTISHNEKTGSERTFRFGVEI